MADRLRSIVYAANLLIEYTERNTTFDAGARVQVSSTETNLLSGLLTFQYRNWTSDLRGDLDRLEKDYSLQNAGDNSIRIARERTLHFLRLERAILCGRWDEVRKLTQSLHECRDLNLNRYLADLVLSSDMPPDMAMGCMRVRIPHSSPEQCTDRRSYSELSRVSSRKVTPATKKCSISDASSI